MDQFVRKRIIGIAFGEQEISVCAHFQDQIAEVLRLPAVFTVSPVGEVLTGNRAIRYAEICHSSRPATAPQAQPQSIYRYLDQHAWNPEAVFSWKGMRITAREILNSLLQDLKQEFSATVYGNCDTCVLAVPSMDLRVQAAVSQAVETAGFSVIRVLDFALAGALRFAKDWSKEGYFLSIMSDAEHVAAALVEYGGGVVELLSAAERMHSGDAGSVLSGLLWEMKQALGPAMASGRLYEDEALLQMPLRAFPGLCMASRQSGLLQAAGLGEAVNYAEHPERTAAIGAAMQGGKLDGWAEMEDTLLLECLPCALHLEPEGTGHVIIPEQTTIPTRSKKRARCRVAEMGSDSRITVSMGQELSRYAGCEEGQTAALRSWKISELQTPFAGYPAELELELMVGLDIRAVGSGLQVTNRETGESYLFYRFVSEAVAEEWFGGKSDGKQDDGADSYGTCGEASERKYSASCYAGFGSVRQFMGLGDNDAYIPCTGRAGSGSFKRTAAGLKAERGIFTEAGAAALCRRCNDLPSGGAGAGSAGSGYRAGTCADCCDRGGDAHNSGQSGVWPAWNFRSCKWGREDHGRLLQRAAPGSETVSECDTGGSACDAV